MQQLLTLMEGEERPTQAHREDPKESAGCVRPRRWLSGSPLHPECPDQCLECSRCLTHTHAINEQSQKKDRPWDLNTVGTLVLLKVSHAACHCFLNLNSAGRWRLG